MILIKEAKLLEEQIGSLVGKILIEPGLNLARERTKYFKIQVKGAENVQKLKGKPFLIAANHIKPSNIIARHSQLSPDALIIEQEVFSLIGAKIKLVAKSDNGWWAENIFGRHLQKISQPLTRGASKGAGYIPVYKNPGSSNHNLMSDISNAVADGYSILIFPQGIWFKHFDPSQKFYTGAARMALQDNLPIVPVFINGCDRWWRGTKVNLVFGKVINPKGTSVDKITELIKEGIINAQDI
jgi:1-acyl-sn-glycerol-3-phosphate acyltransferase